MSKLKLEWTDEVTLNFEPSVNMGHDFDWDTLEITQEQTTTCRGDFKVFASGHNKMWSVYGGDLAYLIFQEFKTIDAAKSWVQNYHNECLIEIKESKISKLQSERDELLSTLEGIIAITEESHGVDGYHQNGDIADWDEFEEVKIASELIKRLSK